MTEDELRAALAERVYLGDGLYASHDGYQIALAASNGECDHDTVYLDPSVQAAYLQYIARIHKLMEEYNGGKSK